MLICERRSRVSTGLRSVRLSLSGFVGGVILTANLAGAQAQTADNGAVSSEASAVNSETALPTCGLPAELASRLRLMLAAGEQVGYRGTLLIEYSNDREFVAVDTAADGPVQYTRLNHSDTPIPQTVALPTYGYRRGLCELQQWYSFAVEASDQVVAGRSTWRLSARPRDTLRLGYVMDIDRLSGMPLRVVTVTPEGQILERFEFANVTFTDTPPIFMPAVSSKGARYRFAGLPPGFALIGEGSDPIDFLVASDGMASVTVFIEEQPRALTDGEGVVLRGSTLAYTRGTADNYLITVMGEVPVATARLLADAIRRRPTSEP